MKKNIALLLTAGFLFAFLALAGCAPEEKEPNGGTQDPEPLTEAEWESAFSAKSFTNYTMSGTMVPDSGKSSEIFAQLATDGNDVLIYTKVAMDTDPQETYYKETEDTVYRYSKNGDIWICEESDYFNSENVYIYCAWLIDQFSLFTFDDSTGDYTAPSVEANYAELSQTFENCLVRFENKKLSHLEYKIIPDNVTLSLEYSDYGTTSVTLPQVGA